MAIPLYINTSDLESISGIIREATEKVSHAFDKTNFDTMGKDSIDQVTVPNAISPHLLSKALKQFLEVLYRVDSDQFVEQAGVVDYEFAAGDESYQGVSKEEISEVGNHGLQLLDTLCEWARVLNLPFQEHQIKAIMVMVALWVARHGGKLDSIESVVNTLAEIANSTAEQEALADLSYMMGELIDAVSPETKFDFENADRQQPWRILNLNRGIIATRSHDPEVMEQAFEELIRNIPEEAEKFFSQGVKQMDELNYPEHVRNVVVRYYNQSRQRVLH